MLIWFSSYLSFVLFYISASESNLHDWWVPFFSLSGFRFTKESQVTKRKGSPTGDWGVGEDWSGGGRFKGRRSLWASEVSHIAFLCVFWPTPTQKNSSHSNCHPSIPSGAQRCCTWSLWSCNRRCKTGTGSCLSSCIRGSRGGYPCQHDTPLHRVGGH